MPLHAWIETSPEIRPAIDCVRGEAEIASELQLVAWRKDDCDVSPGRTRAAYAVDVPDKKPEPTHVLTRNAVRWGIERLGAQKLHPTFLMYLYLRIQQRAGKLDSASASSEEVLSLIRMPGHPNKPFYNPLVDRGDRSGSPLPRFWRAQNIPGSWSPGSIARQTPASWLSASGSFVLPDDHLELALTSMLYGLPVSALAMGAYFLRNDGFVLDGKPGAADLIAAFRAK